MKKKNDLDFTIDPKTFTIHNVNDAYDDNIPDVDLPKKMMCVLMMCLEEMLQEESSHYLLSYSKIPFISSGISCSNCIISFVIGCGNSSFHECNGCLLISSKFGLYRLSAGSGCPIALICKRI